MLCPRCQRTLDPGASFCGNCGQQIAAGTQAPADQILTSALDQPEFQSSPPMPAAPIPTPIVDTPPPSQSTSPPPFSWQPAVPSGPVTPAMPPQQPLAVPYPAGLPPQPAQPGYIPVVASDHSGKAIASFVLGVLCIPGSIIPIVGIVMSVLAIVFGTLSIRSARKVLAIIGLSLAAVGLLASIFFWVHNTQTILKERRNGTAPTNSATSGQLQTINTPCYTTKIPAAMKLIQTTGSCTFLGTNANNGEQAEVKVLQVPGLTASNLSSAAKADAANVVSVIPGGSIASEQAATFAGSQAYVITIKATDGSAGTISYVYDTTIQGNMVIVLRTQARATKDNYDLSSIESNWSWL